MTPDSRRWWQKSPGELRSDRSVILGAVALGLFVDMVVYGVVVPILPGRLVNDLGCDANSVGILFACYAAGLLAVTPIIGYLSDRFNNRQLPMLAGLCGLGASTLLFGFAETYATLVLARVAQGVSGGISWTIGLCVVADIYRPRVLGNKMGKALSANTIGLLIGPPLGGILYGAGGYLPPFLVCSALAFLDFAVWAWIRIPTRDEIAAIHAREDALDKESETPTSPATPGVSVSPEAVRHTSHSRGLSSKQTSDEEIALMDVGNPPNAPSHALRRTPSTLSLSGPSSRLMTAPSVLSDAITVSLEDERAAGPAGPRLSMLSLICRLQVAVTLLVIFACASVVAGIEPVVPIFLETRFGLSSVLVGLVYGGSVLPSIAGALVAGPASDRWGRKNISAAGALLCAGAGALAAAVAPTLAGTVVGLAALSMAASCALTPALPELGEIVIELGGGANAQVYALFNIAYGAGMTAGPLAVSAVYQARDFPGSDGLSGFRGAMLLLAVIMLVLAPAVLAAWILQRRRGRLS